MAEHLWDLMTEFDTSGRVVEGSDWYQCRYCQAGTYNADYSNPCPRRSGNLFPVITWDEALDRVEKAKEQS